MAGSICVWQHTPLEVLRLVFDACPGDRCSLELVCKTWANVVQQMPCTTPLHLRAPTGQQQTLAATGWLLRHRRAVLQDVRTSSYWVLQNLATCDVGSLRFTFSGIDSEALPLNHPTLQSLELTVNGDCALQLGHLPGLRSLHLYLRDCTCVASFNSQFGGLDHLRGLQSLVLSVPVHHEDFDLLYTGPIQYLTGLQTLDFTGCRGLTNLTFLPHFTELRTLFLNGCIAVDDLRPVQQLTSLQALDLSFCAVSDLRPLQHLTGVITLALSGCDVVSDLSPLRHLTSLQTLLVGHLGRTEGWEFLHHLTGLKTLDLSNWDTSNLQPLKHLTSLQTLDLYECWVPLQPLQYLTALQTLRMKRSGVSDLQPLKYLTCLKVLDLRDYDDITELSPLKHMSCLQTLNLIGCTGRIDLWPLQHLTRLRTLDIRTHHPYPDYPDVQPLQYLTGLHTLRQWGVRPADPETFDTPEDTGPQWLC
eukprot:jgi/Chrzof1/5275/Cz15g20110.t1